MQHSSYPLTCQLCVRDANGDETPAVENNESLVVISYSTQKPNKGWIYFICLYFVRHPPTMTQSMCQCMVTGHTHFVKDR